MKVFLSARAIISSVEYEGERPELNYNYDEREISRCQTLPLLLLAALLFGLLDLTEGAKGSVRAGMMSRTNRRRNPNRLYDSSWDGNGEMTGLHYRGQDWVTFIICIQTQAMVPIAGKMGAKISAMKSASTSKSIIMYLPPDETRLN